MTHPAVSLLLLSLAGPGWAAAPPFTGRDPLGDPLPRFALRRLGSNRLRAPDLIWNVALSPDGRVAVTAGGISLLLWDFPSGRVRAQLEDPAGRYLGNLVFSPDGKALAATTLVCDSRHNGFCVWDVATGKLQAAASVPGQPLAGWAFSPDSRLLAGSRPGEGLVLFDAATGRRVRAIDAPQVGQRRVAFAPCGTQVAAPLSDGKVVLFRVATGEVALTVPGEKDRPVFDLAFSPDGRRLATLPRGGGVRLWDLPAGRERAAFPLDTKEDGCRVAFTEGGRVLVALDSKAALFRLDAQTGKELSRWDKRRERFGAFIGLAAGEGPILFCEWGSCQARVVDLRAGREVGDVAAGHPGPVRFLAVSPDGRRLAAASSSGFSPVIRLWDLGTGKPLRELPAQSGALTDLVWSPDGKLLVSSCDQDRSIRLWDPRSGNCIRTATLKELHVSWLALSPGGERLFASGWKSVNGTAVGALAAWDVRSMNQLRLVETGHRASAPAFPDQETLTFVGDDALHFQDTESARPTRPAVPIEPSTWPYAASADGSTRAHRARYDNNLCVLEGDTGIELARLRAVPHVCLIALSGDGGLLALTAEAGRIELFDAVAGAHLADLRHPAAKLDQALAFSPDGTRLVGGGSDSTVLVWDLRAALRGRAAAPKPLDAAKRREHWAALGSRDPAAVRAALLALRADPAGTLQLADAELQAGKSSADEERVRWLIQELDADSFPRRERAAGELARIGAPARLALEKATREGGSAEVKRRAQALLNLLGAGNLSEGQLRRLRLARLLTRIGGAGARRLLGRLAEGSAYDPATRVAKAYLRRLPATMGDSNR